MNLTKSVRALATDINAAPNYDSNDEVSEKNRGVQCVHIHNMPLP
jgi:hypothetical protein